MISAYQLASRNRSAACKSTRHELAHALLLHGHAEQPVHAAHGHRMVGDDEEARLGRARHLLHHVAEAVDIGVVERRVHLVEHADRRGVRQEHREDQRERRQRLLAAGEQRQHLRLLAGRAAEDFEAAFQRIVALDKLKLRLAAGEQDLEQPFEMRLHRVEGFEQALAAFLVEVPDCRCAAWPMASVKSARSFSMPVELAAELGQPPPRRAG